MPEVVIAGADTRLDVAKISWRRPWVVDEQGTKMRVRVKEQVAQRQSPYPRCGFGLKAHNPDKLRLFLFSCDMPIDF
jgi:hypothetical protein